MSKKGLRQAVMWVIAADFPVLFVGAVTIESAVLTVAALVVLGAAAVVAALVY